MDFRWLDEAVKWAEEAAGRVEKRWAEARNTRPEEWAWAGAWTMVARAERAASAAWAEVERRNWEYDALDPGGMLVPGIGSADVQIRLMAGRRAIKDAGRRSAAGWAALAKGAARARRTWPPRAEGGIDMWAAAEAWAAAEVRARQARLDAGMARGMNKNLEEVKKIVAEGGKKRGEAEDASGPPPGRRPPKTAIESSMADAERAAAAAERAAAAAASAYERALELCLAADREGTSAASGRADDGRLA